jgi:predicted homoserine dehydrogenase-like protein
MGLAEGNVLKRDVKRDDLLTLDDVEVKNREMMELYLGQ